MRITFIAGTYQPERCGVAHYTARLRETLAHQGVDSVVLTTQAAASEARAPDVQGVVSNWQFADLFPLLHAVRNSGTKLLHIQHAAGTYEFERAIFLLPLLLRISGWRLPIVTTVHEYGWWEWQPKGVPPELLESLKLWGQRYHWWDREDGFLLTLSNAVITTNQVAAVTIAKRLPRIVMQMHQIPIAANVTVTPIERTTARQLLRQKCNWARDVTVIVFFGFLHPVKGLETLLSAFKQVQQVQPQTRLLLIGGVESLALRGAAASRYWEQLHTLVAELELEQTVHFTGYVSATAASEYLAGADLGVLPFNYGVTLKSGSLLTLLAHGLPVIATRPPAAELIEATLPVRLIPPKNVTALKAELLELLKNRIERFQLGENGLAFVQNFSWEKIGRSHLSVYQTVTEK